tara:strand:+ start:278 stop:553 length:276 start_codon:yes stop_codon:yes gene_type:complete
MKASNEFIKNQIAYYLSDAEYHQEKIAKATVSIAAIVNMCAEAKINIIDVPVYADAVSSKAYHQDYLDKAFMHLDILYVARDAKADNPIYK